MFEICGEAEEFGEIGLFIGDVQESAFFHLHFRESEFFFRHTTGHAVKSKILHVADGVKLCALESGSRIEDTSDDDAGCSWTG